MSDRALGQRLLLQTLDRIGDFGANSSAIVALVAAALGKGPLRLLRAHQQTNLVCSQR